MNQRITASQLYSHLTCPHRVAMDLAGDPALRDTVSPFVQLLWENGNAHEREVVAGLGAITDLSMLSGEEREAATREAIARREPLIYGGRVSIDELLGEPDLLRFEHGGYVAIDIKSGAGREGGEEDEEGKAKKTYGVQIALYTDILIRMKVAAGRYGYILDAHLHEHRYDLDPKLGPRSDSIWEIYVKARAATLALLRGAVQTTPALCAKCKQCVWRSACYEVLQATQDLTLVAELVRAERDSLQGQFPSLVDLAEGDVERFIHGGRSRIPGVGPRRLRRFKRRAALQLSPESTPYLNRAIAWPGAATELFFDIETDPMRDLCYLHGFVIRESRDNASERFHGVYADDLSATAECDAFADAMTLFRQYPDATVIHYSKYERTQYRKLQEKYPQVAAREEIDQLFAGPRALDLYEKVRADSEWPTHDLSVKSLGKWCGFAWRDADPSGASSIEWFDQWARGGDPALRQRLLDYNEDDCRAMRVVLDAMKGFAIRASEES